MQPLARWLGTDNKLIEGIASVQEQDKVGSIKSDEIENAASQAIRAATRAATEMNDPAEVDRIIAEQQKAAEAERELNELSDISN